MPHHTCGYGQTLASTTETDVPALADGVLTLSNNHVLPPRPTNLLYAAAASLNVARVRLSQPSLNVVTSPYLHDVSLAVDFGNPQIIADYSNDPLTLKELEEVVVQWTQGAATSGVILALLGLDFGRQSPPAGNVYTIRGTATGTLAINSWTNVGTIVWQNAPQSGTYVVVGGFAQSAGGKAFRFIFPEQVPRPGGPAILLETNRVHPLFRFGNLGVWGTFKNYALPAVEMISASADTAEIIYMDIMKIPG